jgi:hypothetical protein
MVPNIGRKIIEDAVPIHVFSVVRADIVIIENPFVGRVVRGFASVLPNPYSMQVLDVGVDAGGFYVEICFFCSVICLLCLQIGMLSH